MSEQAIRWVEQDWRDWYKPIDWQALRKAGWRWSGRANFDTDEFLMLPNGMVA